MNKDYHISMKRVALVVLLLLTVCTTVILSSNVSAQTARERAEHTPLPDPYQEYIYNLNLFYNDRKQFETDKSIYLAYKTVQSKEDALASTIRMLESGRYSMFLYLDLIEQDLKNQDEFNSRVKNAILNDITTHKTFLSDSKLVIAGITSLEQGVTISEGLQLRHTYVKATAEQSLTYRDVVTAKKRNDNSREIAADFKNIVAGFPPENRNRETVDKWADEMVSELADNERLLNELVETMYPTVTKDNKPVYELTQTILTKNMSTVSTRQRQYSQRFKEINQIAQEAYREL